MPRMALADETWITLECVMLSKGCRKWKNNRMVMEAILWKLRTGAPWRDIPLDFCSWKTAYNKFNRWSKHGLWKGFFFAYEKKLIQSGRSETEVTLELISMQLELGLVKKEQLDPRVADLLQKYICVPMRMEIQLILKSLGVTSASSKLHQSS